MYESKTGTEKETDLQRIKGQKTRAPKPRVEETIIMKRKKKEYLDNYQYQETKELRDKKPADVVHERLSPVIGGTVEEVSYQKTTLRSGSAGKNKPGTRTTTTRTDMKENKSTANVRPGRLGQDRPGRAGQDKGGKQEKPSRPGRPARPESGGPFVTTKTETTRIGK